MESTIPDWLQKNSAKSQVLDFTDNFSHVENDVTFRVVLTQMLIEKWDAKIVDIDNAFLNGELEHEIYMTIQKGMQNVLNHSKKTSSEIGKGNLWISPSSKAILQEN